MNNTKEQLEYIIKPTNKYPTKSPDITGAFIILFE